jgi:hypothetical protein
MHYNQKEAIAATSIIILLLHAHVCCRGHYLFASGDVNGVKASDGRKTGTGTSIVSNSIASPY